MDLQQEKDLWTRCRAGCFEAREKLIIAYRPLVFWLAGKFKSFPSVRQDVVQEGMLALINAVDRFDPGRDLRFSTYAFHRIRGQMINLFERSEKRAPVPSDDESLFAEEPELPDEDWLDVACSIERLRGKEAIVVGALFFDGKNPSEVAGEHNMDVSHVYRLRRSAVAKIRGWLGIDKLDIEEHKRPQNAPSVG